MTRVERAVQTMQDPIVLLAVAAAGLVMAAGMVWWTRRPAPSRSAARAGAGPGGEFIRRRVQMLAADGATPERIARDTGLSRDVVMMALRATSELRPTKAAGNAQRVSGRRQNGSTPRIA